MQITAAQLYAIAPAAKADFVAELVKNWPVFAKKYGVREVDTPHSLAHIAAETDGFNRLEESLYYTTTTRLRQVWPSRFTSDAAAAPYVRQPEKLANLVYGGRLGNTGPNDGWLYRGSGCKQTTGKTNFRAVEAATGIGCVANPALLRSFPAALESAMVYWRDTKLSKIVDAGGDVVAKLTKAIQGGTGGLADRRTYTNRALKVFGTTLAQPLPSSVSAPKAASMLRVGSRGQAVEALQRRLVVLGYGHIVGRVDQIFGGATEDAVKLFQQRAGLSPVDGVVGPATAAALERAVPVAAATPLREPSGLDKFIAWLISLFRR